MVCKEGSGGGPRVCVPLCVPAALGASVSFCRTGGRLRACGCWARLLGRLSAAASVVALTCGLCVLLVGLIMVVRFVCVVRVSCASASACPECVRSHTDTHSHSHKHIHTILPHPRWNTGREASEINRQREKRARAPVFPTASFCWWGPSERGYCSTRI